jgi:hypothetical protein
MVDCRPVAARAWLAGVVLLRLRAVGGQASDEPGGTRHHPGSAMYFFRPVSP